MEAIKNKPSLARVPMLGITISGFFCALGRGRSLKVHVVEAGLPGKEGDEGIALALAGFPSCRAGK